jgi:hypothetical protein
MNLVTVGQYKLDKAQDTSITGLDHGYLVGGFNLSPHEESVPFGGRNMCPMAGQ